MATQQRRRPPPSFPDHILELFFARLPPEDPSCLLFASLVCKHWRDLIYDPSFFLHLLELGRAPQMLGFLHDSDSHGCTEYVPTSPFSFPFSVPDRDCWDFLGFRHGRAVFQSISTENLSLLVWVPFTGQRTEVPVPAEFEIQRSYATVICAADACDHRNCHGGPFLIVFVFCDPDNPDRQKRSVSSACVYSSETGAWGELVSTNGVCLICDTPALLVGKSLLYFLSNCAYIVEYDLARHTLVRIDPPYHHDPDAALFKRMILVQAEDDGLGLVFVQPDPDTHGFSDDMGCDCLCLLSRKVNQGGDAEWVKLGVIYLEDSLSHVRGSTSPDLTAYLIGFAEGANTVFVSTREPYGIFTVELQSKRARKVYQCDWMIDRLAPVLTSYTSGSALQAHQGEHHRLAFGSSDEEDGQEGGEEDQAQLLFGRGLRAIERGGFVAAADHLSNALELRVARYGELSPECARTYYQYGRALLKKAQKAPYEKTVEGTTSGSDTRNSEHRDSEEGQNSNRKYQEDGNGDSDKDDIEIRHNTDDSDLDLAWTMLEVARTIVENSKVNTVEAFRILSALTEVFMEKSKRGRL